MTSPTDIGKEPPKQRYTISTSDEFDETFVVERYADYWRRRAERAEGLLRESARWHRHTCNLPYSGYCDCELKSHQARVAAYFASVEG